MRIILYFLFYGFIAFTIAATIFSILGFIKIIKKKYNRATTKKVLVVFSSLAGAFAVMVFCLSSFFIIRFYSLPVVQGGHHADRILLNDVSYGLCDEEYAFNKSLRLAGRNEPEGKILTPEWAIDLFFSSSYYLEDPENPGYIYYPGMMDWLVYKRQ